MLFEVFSFLIHKHENFQFHVCKRHPGASRLGLYFSIKFNFVKVFRKQWKERKFNQEIRVP